jgi:23S rRNA pseudouridine2605 synthase
MPEERLQKILARSGYGSRRSSETLIESGRVMVNGVKAHLGQKADAQKDVIFVDGDKLAGSEPLVYIALHKPRGILSDVDPNDPRPTVMDLVPVGGHLFAVGRLDMDSEGLMLLTNDGELANRLTHPRYQHEKEYRVLVAARPDAEQLATWRRGVVLEDSYKTAPAVVETGIPNGKGMWLRIVMKEGRKRQIREVGKQLGLPVVKIIRIRIGTLLLGDLKPKEWRHLTESEVASLKAKTQNKTSARPSSRIR